MDMENKKKGKFVGWTGALLVHVVLVAFLVLACIEVPEPMEEGGMPVMLGEVPDAGGRSLPTLTEVDVLPQEAPQPEVPAESAEQELLTQEEEETVAVKPKSQPVKKKTLQPVVKQPVPKKTEPKKTEPKKPEKSAAEKAEEERKLAEAKAEQARKAAEEAARQRVSGAFGKGAQMAGRGDGQGQGTQGSPTGNASSGAATGVGGYGSFSLDGRSLGPGGLPKPVYNVQEEGRVVVNITVNPQGVVVAATINPQTNTINSALRKAALDAARKARFNTIEGLTSQSGTITYNFKLK